MTGHDLYGKLVSLGVTRGAWSRWHRRRDIDHVGDFAFIVQRDGDHVVEADGGLSRHFDGAGEHNIWMAEDAVDSESQAS